jgi:flavodoxin
MKLRNTVTFFLLATFFAGTAALADAQTQQDGQGKKLGKVLVIYYSNSGNTEKVALRIRELTGADLYKIETEEEYPAQPKLLDFAKEQAEKEEWPKLKGKAPNLNSYDVIFVGSPVWWYSISPPLVSFLKQSDFRGKPVVAFGTSGGGQGDFFADFEKYAKNAKVVRGEVFANVARDGKINEKTAAFLESLEL